jgi:hypothetical protein
VDTEASLLVSWHRSMSGFSVDSSSSKGRRLVRRPLVLTEINLSFPRRVLNCCRDLPWQGARGVLVASMGKMEKLLEWLGDEETVLILESDGSKQEELKDGIPHDGHIQVQVLPLSMSQIDEDSPLQRL